MKSEKVFSLALIAQVGVTFLAQVVLTLNSVSSGEKIGLDQGLKFIPTIGLLFGIYLLRSNSRGKLLMVAANTILAAIIFGVDSYGSGGIYWGIVPVTMAPIAILGISALSYYHLRIKRRQP